MKIAIMQPYVFPYIGYFQLIKSVDVFVVFDDVNFIKKGWINRNNILTNGTAKRFTIPLENASQNRLISETNISQSNNWQEDFLKTIHHSYKKAPFYLEVIKLLENVILLSSEKISDYNYNSLSQITEFLEIKTKLIKSSDLKKSENKKGSEKILEISQMLGADTYVNAIGGQNLYSKEDFEKNGVELLFIKTLPIEYKQFNHDFVPWLSIIDVMMFNSKKDIQNLLNQYTLI